MIFRLGQVYTELANRVKHLGDKNACDREIEYGKFNRRNAQKNARDSYNDRNAKVNACVTLGAERVPETVKGIAKASDKLCEFASWFNLPR
jgi:hypothetical protein